MNAYMTSNEATSLVINDLYPKSFTTNYFNEAIPFWEWRPYRWSTPIPPTTYIFTEIREELKEFGKNLISGDTLPRIDLYFEPETGDLVCRAAICGIPKDEVTANIERGYLVFRRETPKKSEVKIVPSSEPKPIEYLVKELASNDFVRSVKIPDTADLSAVTSSYAEGIITVRFPIRKELNQVLSF